MDGRALGKGGPHCFACLGSRLLMGPLRERDRAFSRFYSFGKRRVQRGVSVLRVKERTAVGTLLCMHILSLFPRIKRIFSTGAIISPESCTVHSVLLTLIQGEILVASHAATLFSPIHRSKFTPLLPPGVRPPDEPCGLHRNILDTLRRCLSWTRTVFARPSELPR